jgi:hypothetical protein
MAGALGWVGLKPQLGRCQQSTASIQNNSDLAQGPCPLLCGRLSVRQTTAARGGRLLVL